MALEVYDDDDGYCCSYMVAILDVFKLNVSIHFLDTRTLVWLVALRVVVPLFFVLALHPSLVGWSIWSRLYMNMAEQKQLPLTLNLLQLS